MSIGAQFGCNGSQRYAIAQAAEVRGGDMGVQRQHAFDGRRELLVEPDQIEGIAHLHGAVKFFFRHDLTMGPPTPSPSGHLEPG
jgi:hypothetical protein